MQKSNGFSLQGMRYNPRRSGTRPRPRFPLLHSLLGLALKSPDLMLREPSPLDHKVRTGEMSLRQELPLGCVGLTG
jgi:hypothetical protein